MTTSEYPIGNDEQIKVATIDLDQVAGDYHLMIGAVSPSELTGLTLVCPNAVAGGALTSISIQTDDATPQVIISAILGAVANLTAENQIGWVSNVNGAIIIGVGKHIDLTIAGGATGVAYVCDIYANYRPVTPGGSLV